MEERDTVQSQLNCLLKGDGDDRGNEHTAKRWVFVLSHIPASLYNHCPVQYLMNLSTHYRMSIVGHQSPLHEMCLKRHF